MVTVDVDDDVERRIRKPVDLLRFLVGCLALALLVGIGYLAGGAATAIGTGILGAGRRLPGRILDVVGIASTVGVVLLASAIGVIEATRRQYRLLVEAVVTAGVTSGLVVGCDLILHTQAASSLHAALGPGQGATATTPLNPYLAAVVAFGTVLGSIRRGELRRWLGPLIALDVLTTLVNRQTTVLAVLLAVTIGYTVGVAVRYVAGLPSTRPSALEVAAALSAAGTPVTGLRRVRGAPSDTRRYTATTSRGCPLDLTVLDRDQQGAGALYRLYRRARLRSELSRNAPLSLEHALERQALMSYAVDAAGVRTPRLVSCVPVGGEAAVLAHERIDGDTLSTRNGSTTDGELRDVWGLVHRLHAWRIAHRGLTAERLLLCRDGTMALLDPGEGELAAGELTLALDRAQLLVETGLLVGPDRAADVALAQLGAADLGRVLALLQGVVLHRSTRAALRRNRDVLPALRRRLVQAQPGSEPAPVRLERVRLRSVVSLVAGVVGAYLLVGQLASVDLGQVLRSANWWWAAAAAALSAATYLAAGVNLIGFVVERLELATTTLVQVAASFVTLVTPAAVGGVALNVRYLQRSGLTPGAAAGSVGMLQVVAFLIHTTLLLLFAALTGTTGGLHISPPRWVWFVLGALVATAASVVAVPRGRRLLRARLRPTLSQVVPRLVVVAQHPLKLVEGIGGDLVLTFAYIGCLDLCVRALGGSIGFSRAAVVYLTGSALGSAVPTPGGLGAVEAALSAGLTAAGVPGGVAVSSVLLFRLLTFWVPVPVGWVAFQSLQRRQAI
ncbi:MAG TPA: lysylphosphatidylglycerol synthase transmembrane domain-containing protein [Acidimicrobiales bacterium]|nr:lysylphosphatidylglycerol synthase transmembrane domain-containing protein [Acidimicrobiales bacterium]